MSGGGRRRRGARIWGVVAIALCLGAARARAAEPGPTCQFQQLEAARKLYSGGFKCWTKQFGSTPWKALECLQAQDERFVKRYANAAERALRNGGECGLKLRAEALLLRGAQDVDPLEEEMAAGVDLLDRYDRGLRVALQNAAAAFVSRAFKAEIRHAKSPDAVKRDEAYASARAKLENGFAKALAKASERGIAYAGPGADETRERLTAFAEEWTELTRPDRPSFGVAGTIYAAEATFVDSDVNDTSTVPIFNGSFFSAQSLAAPSTLGGYVSVPGAGPFGNLYNIGDTFDTYRVSLRAGQVIVLVLGDDPNQVDIDFCLYGPPELDPVCSLGTGSVELAVAPQDWNDYFVDVEAYQFCNCGGNYVLSIGQALPEAALRAERTDLEFVPGELIVRMAPQTLRAGIGAAALAEGLALERLAGDPSRELRLRLPAAPAAREHALARLGAADAHRALLAKSRGVSANERLRRETLLALKALRGRPDVASAELNTIVRPALVPSDPLYELQWHYPLIHLPQAWDTTIGSSDVVVAVVDTGVAFGHPDLAGQFVPGYDFVADPARARDGDGIDPDAGDPGDLAYGPGASSFHGTHVAGTIAAASDNGLGVVGVASGARVMPVRVLGVQGGTIYDVLQGVRFAAGLPNDSGTVPASPADVINLSLSGGGFSQTAQDVYEAARDAGAIVVAAAGNEATNAPSFPASYAGVVSVSAVDLNRQRTPYSNFGGAIDVTAPGGDTSVDRNGDTWADGVLSTLASDASGGLTHLYAFYQGTSMAAPHVAGVAALMRSVNPGLSPATFDGLLESGALTEDLGALGRDDASGWGLIDAQAAVAAAGATPPSAQAGLSVSPSGLNFGLVLSSAELVLRNAGSEPLSVDSLDEDSGGWLALTPLEVDADGLGRYRVSVDRGALATGTYSATIAIASSAGTRTVPVLMRVGGAALSDAGFHYIVLVDAATRVPLDQRGVAADQGRYDFGFANVPAGEYLLVAGTDLDNDGFICDGGEACGSYPTLDGPTPIVVDRERGDVDFATSFRQSIQVGGAWTTPIAVKAGLEH